jgi:methionyl-tRNA formyltransferase
MPQSLNILLFAHAHPGLCALRALQSAGHTIQACVNLPTTQPWLPSVQDECRRQSIPCSTDPIDLELSSRPDVILSIFYKRKIEMPFLALANIGAFNVAASQLPRYRGHFPFRWAILNNESMWGVTVHQMTQTFCDGAVLHRRPLVLKPHENAYDLYLRLADAMATAAVEAANKLAAGDFTLASVEPAGSQFFGHEIPFAGQIDWNQSAARIDAFIRALDFGRTVKQTYQHLTPPAAATINSRNIGIYKAHFGGTMSSYPPGTITRCDDQVWAQTGRGHLVIERIVTEGENHEAPGWFVSQDLRPGDTFDVTHAWTASALHKQLSQAA